MYITSENISEFYLHDAEIKQIVWDYNLKRIIIDLYLDQSKNVELIFENVLYTDISFLEPWGAGKYIFSFEIDSSFITVHSFENIGKGYSAFCILLNSGDKINVISNQVTYHEEVTS